MLWDSTVNRAIDSHLVSNRRTFVRVPKTVPPLELFSSKGGTFRFQGGNFRVPAVERFAPYGGIEKSLGRNEEIPRAGRFAPTLGGNFQTGKTIYFLGSKHLTISETPLDFSGNVILPLRRSGLTLVMDGCLLAVWCYSLLWWKLSLVRGSKAL